MEVDPQVASEIIQPPAPRIEQECSDEGQDLEPIRYANDRGHVVYLRPETISKRTNHNEDESDDFFELTEDEVGKMFQRNLIKLLFGKGIYFC